MGERKDLWKQYEITRDPALRKEIIEQNVPLVRYVLGRLSIPVLDEEVYDDLVGQGILGLIDAVDRFEPQRGLCFSTYATLRIRGQILDALRAMDILPRGARQRVKKIEKMVSRLRMRLGREPSDREVASALDLDIKTYHSALMAANCDVLSIDATFEADRYGNMVSLQDLLCDHDNPEPEENLEEIELRQRLAMALRKLPQRTQLLLSLYYYEGLTMKEIGQVLDLSESRVSQLHARAVANLRASLEREDVNPNPMPAVRLPHNLPVSVFVTG